MTICCIWTAFTVGRLLGTQEQFIKSLTQTIKTNKAEAAHAQIATQEEWELFQRHTAAPKQGKSVDSESSNAVTMVRPSHRRVK